MSNRSMAGKEQDGNGSEEERDEGDALGSDGEEGKSTGHGGQAEDENSGIGNVWPEGDWKLGNRYYDTPV